MANTIFCIRNTENKIKMGLQTIVIATNRIILSTIVVYIPVTAKDIILHNLEFLIMALALNGIISKCWVDCEIVGSFSSFNSKIQSIPSWWWYRGYIDVFKVRYRPPAIAFIARITVGIWDIVPHASMQHFHLNCYASSERFEQVVSIVTAIDGIIHWNSNR